MPIVIGIKIIDTCIISTNEKSNIKQYNGTSNTKQLKSEAKNYFRIISHQFPHNYEKYKIQFLAIIILI